MANIVVATIVGLFVVAVLGTLFWFLILLINNIFDATLYKYRHQLAFPARVVYVAVTLFLLLFVSYLIGNIVLR